MRDYQTKANEGALPDTITTTRFGAGEFNSIADENKTAVSRSGQTLAVAAGTSEETDQLGKALFINGVSAGAMQDSGAANAYVLTPITGSAGLVIPDDYDHINGALFNFTPANAPTGNSTVDLGQTAGTLLGTKKLLTQAEEELTAGAFGVGSVLLIKYDAAADSATGAFIILGIIGIDTVLPHTGGGILVVGRINQIRDGGTYILPPLADLPVDGYVDAELPDLYSDYEPIVEVDDTGTETVENIAGVDTQAYFNPGARYTRFTKLDATTWGN